MKVKGKADILLLVQIAGVRPTFSHMETPSSCIPGFSIKRIFPEY